MSMTLHERSMKLLKHRIRSLHHKEDFNFVFMGDRRGNPDETCYTMASQFELVLKKAVKLNPLFIIHGGAGAPLFKEVPLTLNDYHFVEFHVNRHCITGPLLFRDFGAKRKPCI